MLMLMLILFLHGWQSTPGGLKPTYLKDHGHTVLNPALPDDDFERAVRIGQAAYDRRRPDVVVGSSRGRRPLPVFHPESDLFLVLTLQDRHHDPNRGAGTRIAGPGGNVYLQ